MINNQLIRFLTHIITYSRILSRNLLLCNENLIEDLLARDYLSLAGQTPMRRLRSPPTVQKDHRNIHDLYWKNLRSLQSGPRLLC